MPARPATGDYWNRTEVITEFQQLPPPPYLLTLLCTCPPRTPHAIGLDAGCGGGRNLTPLAKAGYQPFGIDVHSGMLRAARRNCPTAALNQASVTAIPLGARSCEVVICHGVLHNLASAADIQSALCDLARVMTHDAALSLNMFSNQYIDGCLRRTSDADRFVLPNGQEMTLIAPAQIEGLARQAGLGLLTAPVTYLRDADPGRRSVWRGVLVHQSGPRGRDAQCL